MRIKIRKDIAEIDFWINNSTAETLEKCRDWILTRTDLDESLPLDFNQFFKEEWAWNGKWKIHSLVLKIMNGEDDLL